MTGKRFFHELCLRNFLSFGENSQPLRLEPLNVFIGPNASGKSNLLEAVGLLAATPRDLVTPIQKGGGIGDWLWKGRDNVEDKAAEIEVVVYCPLDPFAGLDGIPLRYRLSFTDMGQFMRVVDEVVEEAELNT